MEAIIDSIFEFGDSEIEKLNLTELKKIYDFFYFECKFENAHPHSSLKERLETIKNFKIVKRELRKRKFPVKLLESFYESHFNY